MQEVRARMQSWDFHLDTYGIKGGLEEKKAAFFVSHDTPSWLNNKKAHVPDSKNIASRSSKGRKPTQLPEARREIIVASGASQHMIGENELHDSEKATIRRLSDPFLIQTAHGIVPCGKEARIYIHDLSLWVWAGLLEDSPSVLSMGLLCKTMGFAFSWKK